MLRTARSVVAAAMVALWAGPAAGQQHALVFQSDFGLAEGSIAEMMGVAYSVSPTLRMFDLTHLIPAFDIWEAAVRLRQAAPYWPAGTVFVSIVDPGVGTERKAVVVRSATGHYFVGPDNGTFTFVAEYLGVDAVREIDERINRLPGSNRSHTFHGRDIFAYTAARLAAGVIGFDDVGPARPAQVVSLAHQPPVLRGGAVLGDVLAIDKPFGNVWTNIPARLVDSLGATLGDTLAVIVSRNGAVRFSGRIPFVKSFGEVGPHRELGYLDSQLDLALAINRGNFAARHRIGRGGGWRVEVRRLHR